MQEFFRIIQSILFDFIFLELNLVWFEIAVIILYLLFRKRMNHSDDRTKKKARQIILKICLAAYILLVLWAAVLSRQAGSHGKIMLIPFSAWGNDTAYHKHFLENFFMMTPIGILLPSVDARWRSWKRTAGFCTVFAILLETLQLVTRTGDFQLDDIWANAVSGLLGFLVFCLKERGDS